MKYPIFTGASTAIVTPFSDGGVNFYTLAKLIDIQIDAGMSAIIVCGTTGESSTMTYDERLETISFAVKHSAGRIKVIAGTGSNNTQNALHLSKDAEAAGADGLLIVTPYYNKTTQAGLIAHYTYIADNVNIPIILYNVPSRTGMSFTASTYKILSGHPNINGVKEASSNLQLAMETIRDCGDQLHVWSGNDELIVPLMSVGAKGVISTAGNLIPYEIAELTTACLNGDFAKGAKLQLEYLDIINSLFSEVNPIPIKAALNLLGYDVGSTRLPLTDMSGENLAKLMASMQNLGLL